MLRRALPSSTTAAMLVGVAGVAVIGGVWACPFHAVTGLYCPGCGMTRAATALAGLDPTTALHQNALVLVLPLLMISARRGRMNDWLAEHQRPLIAAAIIVTALFTLARNTIAPGLAPF